MTLLALLAARAQVETPDPDPDLPIPDPSGPEPDPILSVPPTSLEDEDQTLLTALTAPYNAPYLNLPAHPGGHPEGHGVHPSVVDMKAETWNATWNGYRYWMAWTPYPYGNVRLENPCIAASNDKTTWVVPAGLTNPIYPWQGGDDYNSDTELVWDPDRNILWCYWRQSLNSETSELIQAAWTTNGTTWSAPIDLVTSSSATALLSPTVVRVEAGHWRMYYIGDRGEPSGFRTATKPEGPWSSHVDIHFDTGLGDQFNTYAWHVYMRYEYGQFRMVLNTRAVSNSWRLHPAVSNDGINFTLGPAVQSPRVQPWENQHYRSCMVPADNGVDYDVWYSDWGSGWRVAHTQWPKKHWWDLNALAP